MNKKVVLVTGASRGIGSAIVKKFASNSYDVIVNYNNSLLNAEELKEYLESKNTNVMLIKADVSNDKEVENMFNEISKKYQTIDVLVNNAGISNDTLPLEKTKEDFMHVLEVNLYGIYNVTKNAYKYMTKKSTIINIASTNAIDTFYPESLDYDASKSGVLSLTHNFAKLFAPIRVNAIAPGWVKTEMNKDLDEEQIKKEEKKILLKRFADKEEIANVALFLASDKASYINDSIIRVDGGSK